jgi:hypothetical protein
MNVSVKWVGCRKSGQSDFWEGEKNGASVEQLLVHFENGPCRGLEVKNVQVDE